MIKLSEGGFADLLPDVLKRDTDIQAISYALKMGMGKMLAFSRRTRLLADIDSLPEKLLDYLAVELRAQYYDDAADVEKKREIIRQVIGWHMRAGTPETVREFAKTVFEDGEVEEWFDYGDKPFYFRMTTGQLLTEDIFERIEEMLWNVKNVRSRIGAVWTRRDSSANAYVGTGFYATYKPEAIVCGGIVATWTVDMDMYAGGAGQTLYRNIIKEVD